MKKVLVIIGVLALASCKKDQNLFNAVTKTHTYTCKFYDIIGVDTFLAGSQKFENQKFDADSMERWYNQNSKYEMTICE